VYELASYHARHKTPFAVLGIRASGELVTDIEYLPREAPTLAPLNRLAERVCKQIDRYVRDAEFVFDLPFEYVGTPFQCAVWRLIAEIPAGSCRTYNELAKKLRTAPRPVGGACGANRLPILIPCHRVVAAHGLGGFMKRRDGFPLDIKQWLLRHEGA
jgi:methylated-DNA-[protein]-cysteine S-methyltransferase